MKKSLESNKPSAPPLCQGPSDADLKGGEGRGEFTECCSVALAEGGGYQQVYGGKRTLLVLR